MDNFRYYLFTLNLTLWIALCIHEFIRQVITLKNKKRYGKNSEENCKEGGKESRKEGCSEEGAKKAAPKKAAKKAAPKKAAKKAKRTPNAAFMAPLTPSASLAAVIGNKPVPRAVKLSGRWWDYIKKNGLQDSETYRYMLNADEKLKPVFGKAQISYVRPGGHHWQARKGVT